MCKGQRPSGWLVSPTVGSEQNAVVGLVSPTVGSEQNAVVGLVWQMLLPAQLSHQPKVWEVCFYSWPFASVSPMYSLLTFGLQWTLHEQRSHTMTVMALLLRLFLRT